MQIVNDFIEYSASLNKHVQKIKLKVVMNLINQKVRIQRT